MGKPSVSKKISAPVNNVVSSPAPQQATPQPQAQPVPQPQQAQQPPKQPDNQVPPQPTTPQISVNDLTTLQQFANLDDRAMARAILNSNNVDLPFYLKDEPSATQNLVYSLGMNEAPMVLSNYDWNNYLAANGIQKSQIMFRSMSAGGYVPDGMRDTINLTPDQMAQILMYAPHSYVGGKYGGMAFGAGTYFDMDATGNTGYGGKTIKAILSPQASVITKSDLMNRESLFASKMPLTYREINNSASRFYSSQSFSGSRGERISLLSLGMGYNVIASRIGGGYHNVITRNAMIMNKNIF